MRGFYFIFVAALYYTKQVKALPVVTVAAALTNIVLNLLLIPRIGYMAAAIITFVTFALQAALMYVFARRAFPLPYEWGRLGLIAVLALVSSAALSLFQLPNLLLDLPLKAALVLTFPLMLWGMRIIRFNGFRT
jgi:O-antigen/teichoic acid export membrane protein